MKNSVINQSPFQADRPFVVDNLRLREPQREAYIAVIEHFAQSNEPVLLQIPVGGGKTGLISILPFGISNTRALIVTPNLTIRDSVFRAVNSSSRECFWSRYGVFKPKPIGPFAAVLDGRNANQSDCVESHYVVANVQQIGQAGNRWLQNMSQDFFDLIIIDEGHHNAAQSWQRLMQHFPEAKIVSLTATPFRSDGQDVIGKPIYRYTFRRAMSRGYIKHLAAIQLKPCELSFSFRDSNETATLEQILELREEAWFSRGVALADECNRHIVRESILACEQLRSDSKVKHQIIGAACSVEHAQRISELYRDSGYQAMEIHSKQSKTTQKHVLTQLRSGKIDAIIQVQMLGEGFDHPPLSVAAIFRPFRTLSPYIQFVGRIMRVVVQGAPTHCDNRGYVVSHVGMNTERHWDQFRQLDTEDQELWAELIRGSDQISTNSATNKNDYSADDTNQEQMPPPPSMNVESDTIGFAAVSIYAKVEPASPDTAEIHSDVSPIPAGQPVIVGPQERRRQAKSRLTGEVDNAIRKIHYQLRISGTGKQISRIHPMLKHQTNWAAARFWLYYNLNRIVGRKPRSGQDWSLEEVETAIDRLPSLVEALVQKVNERQTWR